MKVRIVGFGFAGLACAYAASKKGWEIEIFEQSPTPGGMLSTIHTDFGIVEAAANGIINSARVEDLASSLKIDLCYADKSRAKRYIFWGRPTRWPLKLSTSLLLLFKIVQFKFLKPKHIKDQLKLLKVSRGHNLTQWCKSFLSSETHGHELATKLLTPALGGVYGLNTDQLDAELVLTSLLKRRVKTNASFTRGTVAPKNGMSDFFSKFLSYLSSKNISVYFNKEIESAHLRTGESEHVIIATHPKKTFELLNSVEPELAKQIKQIDFLSLVTITLFFKPSPNDFIGFGCLFPEEQKFFSRGVLFNSDIFSQRSKNKEFRSETFIISRREVISESDEEILNEVLTDRSRILGRPSEKPLDFKLTRWPSALPIYDSKLREILSQLKVKDKNIHLIGNYLGDLSLSKILDNAFDLIEDISKASKA